MFRIGEFARFTRVSVKRLRHYDEIGLLPAAHVDPASGYRYYRADQLPRLNRILLLRELGLGLEQIAALLADAADPAELDRIYAQHEHELVRALAAHEAQLTAIRARRAMLATTGDGPDVVVRPVPGLLVAALTGAADDDVADLFYELESYVRDLGARAESPPLTLLPEPDDPRVTVAVPLSWPVPPNGRVEVRRLGAVPRMACAVQRGGYATLLALLQQMLTWLERTGQLPAGPIREVYLRFDAEPELNLPAAFLTGRAPDMVTELQIPLA